MKGHAKQNAKSPNLGVPSKIPVNGGTSQAPATPPNLGVPTPELPFDPTAAMGGAPGMPPGADGMGGPNMDQNQMPPTRTPFQPHEDAVQMVQGMIFHWTKEDLTNLSEYIKQLIAKDNEKPATPAE